MATYLVLEFDDASQAETLRQRIDQATSQGKAYRVRGIFRSPSKWCTCPIPTGYHKDEVVRGDKFGWWIHRACRRARIGTHALVNQLPPLKSSNKEIIHDLTSLNIAERILSEIHY